MAVFSAEVDDRHLIVLVPLPTASELLHGELPEPITEREKESSYEM
jgi:hypothetical protein